MNAILVKVLRRSVAGGDQDDALVKEVGKQLLEDHRVGDVCDLELVQTDDPALRNDGVTYRRHGVKWLVSVPP